MKTMTKLEKAKELVNELLYRGEYKRYYEGDYDKLWQIKKYLEPYK